MIIFPNSDIVQAVVMKLSLTIYLIVLASSLCYLRNVLPLKVRNVSLISITPICRNLSVKLPFDYDTLPILKINNFTDREGILNQIYLGWVVENVFGLT